MFKGKKYVIRMYFPRNAWVLAVTSMLWSFGSALANPFQSVFFYGLGAPVFYIGVIAATSSLISAVMLIAGGYIADVWGRKKVIVIFSIISAVSAFLYVFIDKWPFLFLPVIINAITAVYTPAFNATLNDSMDAWMRPLGFASYTVLTTIPSIFSPFVGGMLIQSFGSVYGLKIAFLISGAFGVVACLYRAAKLEETFKAEKEIPKMNLFGIIKNALSEYSVAIKRSSSDAKKLLLYTVFAGIGTSLSTLYVSLYLINSSKVTPEEYGFLIGISSIATIMLLLPTVGLIKRAGLKKAAVLSALTSPITMLTFVSSNGINDLMAWSTTSGVSGAMITPTISSLQGNVSKKEERGKLMALFSITPLVVAAPMQLVSGWLYANTPHLTTFVLAIPFYLMAIFVLLSINSDS